MSVKLLIEGDSDAVVPTVTLAVKRDGENIGVVARDRTGRTAWLVGFRTDGTMYRYIGGASGWVKGCFQEDEGRIRIKE